jgi:hypothetical protein
MPHAAKTQSELGRRYNLKKLLLKMKQLLKRKLVRILLRLLRAAGSVDPTGLFAIKQQEDQKLALNSYSVLISGLIVPTYQKSQINRIAVFGVLPPEKTGIAYYNAKTFGINDIFNVFSDMKTQKDFMMAGNIAGLEYKNNFLFLESYNILRTQIDYNAKIFILGNSEHNIPYLKQAICEPDKQYSWLYFHDVNIMDLIYFSLQNDFESYKKIFCKVYPEFMKNLINLNTLEELKNFFHENTLCGARFVVYLTGITKVIVNNDLSWQLIENEFSENMLVTNIKIVKLFLPIFRINDICSKKPYVDNNTFLIGSFGLPNDRDKAVKTIIEAVSILNKEYNINSKCIIAGYRADKYYESLATELKKFVIPFSDVAEKELFSIMQSVHMAVQLRDITHGESSGIINQLIGMNKRIITTVNFLDREIEEYCNIVPRFVSKEILAATIMKELQTNNKTDNSLLLNKFGFQILSNKILSLCDYTIGNL